MPELKNVRWERFARGVVAGLTQSAAYTAAGYKGTPGAVAANATRLISTDNLASRVAELRAELTQGTVITAKLVLDGLLELAQDKATPAGVRRAAWRDLGEYLSLFKQVHVWSPRERAKALAALEGITEAEALQLLAEVEAEFGSPQ